MLGLGFLNFTKVNTYLAATLAYLNSDATLSGLSKPVKDGIDRWIRDLNGYSNGSYTTYNVWSRIIAIYPIIGGTSTSVAKNAKNPGSYTLTHTGGPTISAAVGSNIAYNGTTQFSDTGFIPTNDTSVNDLLAWGIHRRDSNDDGNATHGIASSGNSYGIIRSDINRQFFIASNRSDASTGSLAVNALYHNSMSSSTVLNAYRNGGLLKTNTGQTINSTGVSSFYIGACHGGSTIFGGPNTVDYLWLANNYNWTDNENAFMYNSFNALQTILGR